jgi:hypothetical protein
MEEAFVPLASFDLTPSIDDLFWQEKMLRFIDECDSVLTLKETASLLTKLATTRQTAIRGLVKDIKLFNNVVVNPDDLANPSVKKED